MVDPLWKAMYREDAWCVQPDEYRDSIAPVIRALRDWLIPNLKAPGLKATDDAYAIWEERKALHSLLTSEAELAEKQL